jgi:hypothetical protein
MLSEETVKQIFFYCDQHEENAVIADEVDIVQFARKIEAFIEVECARKEHARCVQIVQDMNKDVARALDNQKP